MRHQINASGDKRVIVYPSVILVGQVECMITSNGVVQSCFALGVHQAQALADALSIEAEKIAERDLLPCLIEIAKKACPCGVDDDKRPCFCTDANKEFAAGNRRAVRG